MNKKIAPKAARKAKYKDRLYNIALRVEGSLKNQIIDAANRNKMMLSEYVLYCVWEHMRSERGVPVPGVAVCFGGPNGAFEGLS